MKNINSKLKQINTYITTNELISLGFYNKDIKFLCDTNKLIKIKHGLYRKFNTKLKEQSFIDISMAIPKGVICLLSALAYYKLTTFIPKKINISLPRGIRKPKEFYQNYQVFYMKDNIYKKNINMVKDGKYYFKIYDIERTICDCFKYRNKIGTDILKESFNEYIKLKNKNISKLIKTAKELKVEKILTAWLTATV